MKKVKKVKKEDAGIFFEDGEDGFRGLVTLNLVCFDNETVGTGFKVKEDLAGRRQFRLDQKVKAVRRLPNDGMN